MGKPMYYAFTFETPLSCAEFLCTYPRFISNPFSFKRCNNGSILMDLMVADSDRYIFDTLPSTIKVSSYGGFIPTRFVQNDEFLVISYTFDKRGGIDNFLNHHPLFSSNSFITDGKDVTFRPESMEAIESRFVPDYVNVKIMKKIDFFARTKNNNDKMETPVKQEEKVETIFLEFKYESYRDKFLKANPEIQKGWFKRTDEGNKFFLYFLPQPIVEYTLAENLPKLVSVAKKELDDFQRVLVVCGMTPPVKTPSLAIKSPLVNSSSYSNPYENFDINKDMKTEKIKDNVIRVTINNCTFDIHLKRNSQDLDYLFIRQVLEPDDRCEANNNLWTNIFPKERLKQNRQ